jgi:uncharacterized membrane protein
MKLFLLIAFSLSAQATDLFTEIYEAREVSFEDVRPILEKRCVGCHSSNDSGDWSHYRIAFSKRKEIYLRVVELRNMPLYSKMPEEERNLIKEWVEQGAKEF